MLVPTPGSAVPQVKLLDFGVAKIREDSGGGVAGASANGSELATSAGALMGTVRAFTTTLLPRPTARRKTR